MLNFKRDNQYYLSFSYFYKIGPQKITKLLAYFPDLGVAFNASRPELERAGLEAGLAGEFTAWRKNFSLAAAKKELENEKINFITWNDASYPKLLKEISRPPYILYYRGNLGGGDTNRLAVVGARQHSAYASKIISELLPPLIRAGIEIISGLAIGVDALAHQAALSNQGITLAILGSGLSTRDIYPAVNRQLADKIIASGGALISEFPPGTAPLKQNFPQRNRIISGLCQATLVIEARQKSGSLITAQSALEQNREVLAVPGNIFSEFSQGPNGLISAGAKTVLGAEDVLEIFNLQPRPIKKPQRKKNLNEKFQPENEIEGLVYGLLKQSAEKGEKISTDEIIKISQLDTATINSTLSMLEIKGIAKNDGTGYDLN